MPRPDRLVVVLGTGTGVGKTWVAVAALAELRGRGRRVAARKPVQSFDPGDPTDAERLAAASGEAPEQVCPAQRWYPRPLAPPMAAEVLGWPGFTIAHLVAELTWPDGIEIGLVEGAGGVRSPLADDGDAVDLLAALRPDRVVLVAGAGLGALNLVRLSVDALAGASLVVYLNRFDEGGELARRNRSWLQARLGLPVATTPAELVDALYPVTA